MTEFIRSWPDSLFYISQAGTTNVREQINKTQLAATLLRALSDAALVDGTGSKLNEILTGLSLGNLSQRHKWRVIYDTTNNRFLVQYNTGTDASKTWAERFRIDSSGNVTTTGTLTISSTTTTSGGVRLGGDLDANDFYIKNAEDIFTNDLRVGNNLTLSNNHTVGLVYIASKTASSSPVIDFSGLTHYTQYVVTLDGVRPATDAVSLLLRTSTNNGASYDSGATYDTSGSADAFPASTTIITIGATSWNLIGTGSVTQDNAATSTISGSVKITSLGSGTITARMRAELEWVESTGTLLVATAIGGRKTSAEQINAIRFEYSSGLITSGTFRLYGLRNS